MRALLVTCLAATTASRAAAEPETRFFPLPMYTTVPNEGSTFGAMPVFMRSDDDVVSSITAPSVSWNSSAHYTGTFRYFRTLAAELVALSRLRQHRDQPLGLVPVG